MRTIKIYCKTCGITLTEPLTEISQTNIRTGDRQNALEKSQFAITSDDGKKEIIVALGEGYLKNHTDGRRLQGCCGSDGMNGPNKVCSNGHEVATEYSDCYMPHYVAFDTDKVTVKQKMDDYEYKTIIV